MYMMNKTHATTYSYPHFGLGHVCVSKSSNKSTIHCQTYTSHLSKPDQDRCTCFFSPGDSHKEQRVSQAYPQQTKQFGT